MRIVHLTQLWSGTTGGPSKYVSSLKRELVALGHDVHVLTTDSGSGAEVVGGSMPLRDARVVARLRMLKPDIVHVHGSVGLLLDTLVYRLMRPRVRVVFTFHTQPITRIFLPGLSTRRHDYGPFSAILARWLLRSADLVTSVSDSIVAAHNETYGLDIRRFIRIPSGGDLRDARDVAASTSPADGNEIARHPLLVSVGVMTWDWKVAGHLVAVRAVASLRRQYSGVLLLIAGDGPHRGVVEREVATLDLDDHVRLLGTVAPDRLLDSADVYVHMAMNEGCSLAIIEAMHAGKPIVAAHAGGTPEVLVNGQTALLIEPEPEQLAAAVHTLVDDRAYADKLAARAREVASQHYTWPVIAAQYAEAYRALLETGPTAAIASK
jgi:glycosyltransferase involved in cell wall biosynthesis